MLFAFEWEILIIPAIGFMVWLVSMLFRNATEPKKNNRRPGGREAEEPRRQTSSDLDRFIADTRRQREMEERRSQRPQPAAPPPRQRRPVILEEVEDEPRPRPAPRPPVLQPMPPRPSVLQPVSPRPVGRPLPVARPVPVLEAVESVSSAPVMQSLTQAALPDLPDLPTAPVDMLKREQAAVSPLLLDLREILRSPKSAQMAFALREILDAPLCRRRRS
jgi:hypothetical protein